MLSELLEQARGDRPLWITELRRAFHEEPSARPLVLRLTLHDGSARDFSCALPRWENEEEALLVRDYLFACVYNCLAVYSGRELRLFFDTDDAELRALSDSLDTAFQLRKSRRHGYGKVISIADRIAANSGGGAFRFTQADHREYTPLPAVEREPCPEPLDEKLRALCGAAADRSLCGIDVGGTDIKLALCAKGRLLCTKEYDWNPALCSTAEEILEPILLLTRLMRACLHTAFTEEASSPTVQALLSALDKDASPETIRDAVEAAEQRFGTGRQLLDGIGLSFPDIVIGNRILGGETPKTEGMRRNTAIDYETAFSKLVGLKDDLTALCREGGCVRITNDGNMAAFTAATELSEGPGRDTLLEGVVAHSLGTDLGTGWLTADGTIPALPLELYDLILDLGSFRSRAWPPEDLRSTRNENSGLPGARRYMGQSAAFRLAQRLDPALLDGFTARDGSGLVIAAEPQDMRKPCLEHLMRRAEEGNAAACEVFREIGRNLAVMTGEMEYLLHTGTHARFLFGRFVKRPAVFRLLEEGFVSGAPGFRLIPSDEGLANTPLMRALTERKDVTVAQFGQAVGSIYFALSREQA